MTKKIKNPQSGFTRTNFSKKSLGGFTIIEVVIVLAIASLILLIVFLAVPSLQRGQRNNARKSDASRVAAAVIEFTTNNPTASLPATQQDCTTLVSSIGTLGQYSFDNPCTSGNIIGSVSGGTADNTLYIVPNSGTATAPSAPENTMILAVSAVCNANTGVTDGSAKQSALLYSIESGNNWTWACINPQ